MTGSLRHASSPWLDATILNTRGVHVRLALIDICKGDLVTGTVLSQIVFWHSNDGSGRCRLRVEADGYLWLAKAHHEWHDEIRVSSEQARRALKQLVKLGLVVTRVRKFMGTPTTHIRLVPEAMERALRGLGSDPTPSGPPPNSELGSGPDQVGPTPRVL